MTHSDPKEQYHLHSSLENSPHYVHSLDTKNPELYSLNESKPLYQHVRLCQNPKQSQDWNLLSNICHQRRRTTYIHPEKMCLVRREKIMNNRIRELIGPFTVLHFNERSNIVAIDQDRFTKRYSTSQIRPFLKKPSMLDESITEH